GEVHIVVGENGAGKSKFVGFDASPDLIADMKEGSSTDWPCRTPRRWTARASRAWSTSRRGNKCPNESAPEWLS
ncbi:MAG: hypothetical protein JXQ73_07700, partial [Phycisphaerae bacterium]|nr:hypothetical protein [Phycisphaerae bacterium]